MATLELDRVRAIALALPEVTERLSHGATCFFVRDKRPLCYFHDHHNDDRVSCGALPRPEFKQCSSPVNPHRSSSRRRLRAGHSPIGSGFPRPVR